MILARLCSREDRTRRAGAPHGLREVSAVVSLLRRVALPETHRKVRISDCPIKASVAKKSRSDPHLHRAVGFCLVAVLSACSPESQGPAASRPGPAAATDVAHMSSPAPVQTWVDAAAAQRIMSARADFDAAELAAYAELDRIMGAYRHQMLISRDHYVRHLAGEVVPATRSAAWLHEHEKRAAYARSVIGPQIATARARLERDTVTALKEFFGRELQARRIARPDYLRYTSEIRKGHFPGFRGRKWTGPPIHEFRAVDVSPEYRSVLQEVRRLWQAQGRRASVITYIDTNQEFYRTLVPRERRTRRAGH